MTPPRPDASTLRPARPDDALCLGVLATQVFLDTCATGGIRPALAPEVRAHRSTEVFEALLADATTGSVVAERDGHLVGFAEVGHGAVHESLPGRSIPARAMPWPGRRTISSKASRTRIAFS